MGVTRRARPASCRWTCCSTPPDRRLAFSYRVHRTGGDRHAAQRHFRARRRLPDAVVADRPRPGRPAGASWRSSSWVTLDRQCNGSASGIAVGHHRRPVSPTTSATCGPRAGTHHAAARTSALTRKVLSDGSTLILRNARGAHLRPRLALGRSGRHPATDGSAYVGLERRRPDGPARRIDVGRTAPHPRHHRQPQPSAARLRRGRRDAWKARTTSTRSVVASPSTFAGRRGDLDWICAENAVYSVVDGRRPNAADLDGITDRPIFITTYDQHSVWLNRTSHWRCLGIDRDRHDPSRGAGRNATRRPVNPPAGSPTSTPVR